MKRKQKLDLADRARFTNKKNAVWFSMPQEMFSPNRVVDIAPYIEGERGLAPRLPCGLYIHHNAGPAFIRFARENGLTVLQAAQLSASVGIAADGLLIPTKVLEKEWKFDLGGDVSLALYALNLMVACAIDHRNVYSEQVTYGAAQPLSSLKHLSGDCHDKTSILTAVFRINGVPARIVGNLTFFPEHALVGLSTKHWWVEACLDGEWHRFDPTLLEDERRSFDGLLDSHKVSLEKLPADFELFLELARETLELYRAHGRPPHLIDRPMRAREVESRIVVPEMDVPEQHEPIEL